MRRKVTLNEKQFKNIIKESVRRILNEMDYTPLRTHYPNMALQDALEKVEKKLANGVPVEEVFDEVRTSGGMYIVRVGDWWNVLGKENAFLCDRWFDEIDDFHEGFAGVWEIGKGHNYINRDGKYIGDRWYSRAGDFRDGFAQVEYKNKAPWYLLRKDGVLCDYETKEPIEDGSAQMTESLINHLVNGMLFENKLNKKRKK